MNLLSKKKLLSNKQTNKALVIKDQGFCTIWWLNCFSSCFSPNWCTLAMLLYEWEFFWSTFILFACQRCVICKQTYGSCTQCCKCASYFHATCASRAGYFMEVGFSELFLILMNNICFPAVVSGFHILYCAIPFWVFACVFMFLLYCAKLFNWKLYKNRIPTVSVNVALWTFSWTAQRRVVCKSQKS
jgi:hypothetical protein